MSKWYGKVGYGETHEIEPGIWKTEIVERPYYGDMNRVASSSQQGESLNDDIQLKHDINIIADAYALQNFAFIKYITIMGVRWKVKSVEVQRPRLALSIGDVYNGPTPESSEAVGGSSQS